MTMNKTNWIDNHTELIEKVSRITHLKNIYAKTKYYWKNNLQNVENEHQYK